MVFIAITLLLSSGTPIFFRQIRPGLMGYPFTLYKFRTMRPPKQDESAFTSDSNRVTNIGRFLRRASLDELPELFNVLNGTMSLVGPRPLLLEYLPLYTERQMRRHDIRPGITGAAQIKGQRHLTLGQRIEIDLDYIARRSLIGDVRLLLKTLAVPFRGSDNPEQLVKEVDDLGFLERLRRDRWENGSRFHLVHDTSEESWLPVDHSLVGTGRQAIIGAFRQGQNDLGWNRLLIPTYFCPEVVASLQELMPIQRYPFSPDVLGSCPSPRSGDAVLVLGAFGECPPWLADLPPESVIIDASHDLLAEWVGKFKPAFVVGSLRKTLPLPDGGVIWSPLQLQIPDVQQKPGVDAAANLMLNAMKAKAHYLRGDEIDKRLYLQDMATAEEGLTSNDTLAKVGLYSPCNYTMAEVQRLPMRRWRHERLSNAFLLRTLIEPVKGVKFPENTFGLIATFPDRRSRDFIRQGLLEKDVFTAVLWPQLAPDSLHRDEVRSATFAERMLHIHTDFRYGAEDMHRVAAAFRECCFQLGLID
jgi:lipopolysaccharide/colanic/teichoic acid biosynthesis glycosyltransferase